MHMITIPRAFAGITLGLIALFTATTPSAQATPPTTDCSRVTHAYQPVCRAVLHQRAYGTTDNHGHPQNWNTNGKTLVHEITHQGYTQGEIADALVNADRDYRDNVTEVRFNIDAIAHRCGHHHGTGQVQEVKGRDGHHYTYRRVICA